MANYTVTFSPIVADKSSVIIAISMENTTEKNNLQKGEKLKALIKKLKAKECKITLLIADHLQRHNSTEAEALRKGDEFLSDPDNKDLVEDKSITTVRWSDFIAQRKEKHAQFLEMIEKASQPGSPLYNKMVKTAKHCRAAQSNGQVDVEKSLILQREEYAAILAMEEFDHLVYPRLTDGMGECYTQFSGKHRFAQFSGYKVERSKTLTFNLFPPSTNVAAKQEDHGTDLQQSDPYLVAITMALNSLLSNPAIKPEMRANYCILILSGMMNEVFNTSVIPDEKKQALVEDLKVAFDARFTTNMSNKAAAANDAKQPVRQQQQMRPRSPAAPH